MAKDYNGSPKIHQVESRRKRLTRILAVCCLCVLFYVLASWQNTTSPPTFNPISSIVSNEAGCNGLTTRWSSSGSSLDFQAHHQVGFNESSVAAEKFPPCDLKYSEHTPCQDPERARKLNKAMLKYRERHCPQKEELLRCLIPAPPKYKNPFKWPQSRDYAWYDNIPPHTIGGAGGLARLSRRCMASSRFLMASWVRALRQRHRRRGRVEPSRQGGEKQRERRWMEIVKKEEMAGGDRKEC